MFFTRRVTISVLFIFLTAEVFHYCLAVEDVAALPAVAENPVFPGLGSPFDLSGVMNNFNPVAMLEQIAAMNEQNLPRYTEVLTVAMKNVMTSITQLQETMVLLQNAQNAGNK